MDHTASKGSSEDFPRHSSHDALLAPPQARLGLPPSLGRSSESLQRLGRRHRHLHRVSAADTSELASTPNADQIVSIRTHDDTVGGTIFCSQRDFPDESEPLIELEFKEERTFISRSPALQDLPRQTLSMHRTIRQTLKIPQEQAIMRPISGEVAQQKYALDFVDLYFRDTFISRSDMYVISQALIGRTVFQSEVIEYDNMRLTVAEVLPRAVSSYEVQNGFIDASTKICFQSRTFEVTLLVHMSSEMWEATFDGRISFDWVLDGFVSDMIRLMIQASVSPAVRVVFFGRFLDKNSPNGFNDCVTTVAVARGEKQLRGLPPELRHQFAILSDKVRLHCGKTGIEPHKVFLPASDSNFLEALILTLDRYTAHRLDRNLSISGHQITVVGAGKGFFRVKPSLVQHAALRMMDAGVKTCTYVCIGRPPMHTTPLFEHLGSSPNSVPQYERPKWMTTLFYAGHDQLFTSNDWKSAVIEYWPGVALPHAPKDAPICLLQEESDIVRERSSGSFGIEAALPSSKLSLVEACWSLVPNYGEPLALDKVLDCDLSAGMLHLELLIHEPSDVEEVQNLEWNPALESTPSMLAEAVTSVSSLGQKIAQSLLRESSTLAISNHSLRIRCPAKHTVKVQSETVVSLKLSEEFFKSPPVGMMNECCTLIVIVPRWTAAFALQPVDPFTGDVKSTSKHRTDEVNSAEAFAVRWINAFPRMQSPWHDLCRCSLMPLVCPESKVDSEAFEELCSYQVAVNSERLTASQLLFELVLQRLHQQFQVVTAAANKYVLTIGHQIHTLVIESDMPTISAKILGYKGMRSEDARPPEVYSFCFSNYLTNTLEERQADFNTSIAPDQQIPWKEYDLAVAAQSTEVDWRFRPRRRMYAIMRVVPETDFSRSLSDPDSPNNWWDLSESEISAILSKFNDYLTTRFSARLLPAEATSDKPQKQYWGSSTEPIVINQEESSAVRPLHPVKLVDCRTYVRKSYDSAGTPQPDVVDRRMFLVVRLSEKFNYRCCYLLEIQWLVCSGIIVSDWATSFVNRVPRTFFRVVPIPCNYDAVAAEQDMLRVQYTVSDLTRQQRFKLFEWLTTSGRYFADSVVMNYNCRFVHITGACLVASCPTKVLWYENSLLEEGTQRQVALFALFRDEVEIIRKEISS